MSITELERDNIFDEAPWQETEPEPGTCEGCGDDVEPRQHPSGREQWLEPLDYCSSCRDRRLRREARRSADESLRDKLWRDCGIPRRKRRLVERLNPDLHPTLQSIVDIGPDDRPLDCGAFIHGSTGTGKTVQAATLIDRYLDRWLVEEGRRGLRVRYGRVSDLLSHLKESFDHSELSYEERLERILEADLLVIDELGAEDTSSFASRVLGDLAEHRNESMRPTLWISNWKLTRLAHGQSEHDNGHGNYDGRIAWRIVEMCGSGDDFRVVDSDADDFFDGNQRHPKQ